MQLSACYCSKRYKPYYGRIINCCKYDLYSINHAILQLLSSLLYSESRNVEFMRKTLPINCTPILSCYGYESYKDAIVSSKQYVNEIIAVIDRISINNEQDAISRFSFLSESITYENIDGELVLRAISNALRFKGILYLKVEGDYDISFRVKHHLYTSPWSLIAAFASASIDEFRDEYKPTGKTPYLYGYFKKTGYWKSAGDESVSINLIVPNNEAYWIKIKKCQETVFSYVSKNGSDWSILGCDRIGLGINSYTGIYMDLGESSYHNWLYSNHLQIFCGEVFPELGPPIEYFFPIDQNGITKANPFIHEYQIPYSLIESQNICLADLIHYCIDQNIYLDISLNEKYIEDRSAYNKSDYYHYNMVFGYDNSNNTVSIFGYNGASKVSASLADFNSILKAFEESDKQDLFLRKHDMGYYPEELNITLIRNLLEDYIYSKDSSWRYSGICVKRDNCSFGLSVYDCITNSEKNFSYFLSDLRVAYFLTEHKKIMKERIEFLIAKNIVSSYFAYALMEKSKKLYDITSTILLLVMKYKVTKDESIKDRLKKHFITVKALDTDLCVNLLRSIDNLSIDKFL